MVTKGEVFGRIKGNVSPANLNKARAVLKKYGVYKGAGGKLPESVGRKMAADLQPFLKSRVGSVEHTIAKSGSSSRDIFEALSKKFDKPAPALEKPAVEEEARRRVVSFKRPKDVQIEENKEASTKDIAKAREHRGERGAAREDADAVRREAAAAAQEAKEAGMRTKLNVKLSQEGRRSAEQAEKGTALEQAHEGAKGAATQSAKMTRVELAPMAKFPGAAQRDVNSKGPNSKIQGITTTQAPISKSTPTIEAPAGAATSQAGPPPGETGPTPQEIAAQAIDTPI